MYISQNALSSALTGVLSKEKNSLVIQDQDKLRESIIDDLIYTAVFSTDNELKKHTRLLIRQIAKKNNINSSSIHALYKAFGEQRVKGFTIPALNIRTLTYDTARIIFSLAITHQIGAVIFEIARSEIDYTMQKPDEYAVCILAAAIKEGYTGPVFLQGDHFQFSKNKYTTDPDQELNKIQELTREAISAEFFNIDIDASTLVDLAKENLSEQQEINAAVTAKMTSFIRDLQPRDTIISIGGEIGHIGGKNSTVPEFEAFMQEYLKLIHTDGISKVSVQTGTSHGGIPLPDGTMADVTLDFSVLEKIGKVAREKYHIGGAVQHGASTLPNSLFHKFVASSTLEVHLATGFQNIVYEAMPTMLKESMEKWIRDTLNIEWEKDWSEEQFLYKSRKKALGPFKQKLWELPKEQKQPILSSLKHQLSFLFEQLHIFQTKATIDTYVH